MSNRFVVDPNSAAEAYPWSPFTVRHELANEPLFRLEKLVEVAATLPRKRIEHNLGEVNIGQSALTAPLNGLTPEETVANIEQCKSWLVLKKPEHLPEYKALLDACLDDLISQLPTRLTRLHDRESYIFVSSPGAVTPFHIDPEHNFLLQIRGSKTVNVWPSSDRDVLPEQAIEQTIYGPEVTRSVEYRPEFATRNLAVSLHAGDGLYIPVHAPHWVQNGADVSISYSVTFRSAWSSRNSGLYAFNAMLRRLGMQPSPVGSRPMIDRLKYAGFRAHHALTRFSRKRDD